jgi:mitochondrial fission protein ELM1
LKKFNYIWIFSDSILGHEIQSQALASQLSNHILVFHCTLRQPWLSFAPRILPKFANNILWGKHQPDINQSPDAIITCGRRMAAIGKYFKRKLNCKHIQILNPGDNPKKYDVLVCPEHDMITGTNVISTKGSLHNISYKSLNKIKENPEKLICLILGNPANGFFKELNHLSDLINQYFSDHDLVICGSRRTPEKHHQTIRSIFSNAKAIWLSNVDGENPYQNLLANSDIIIVTADSINMLSEACTTTNNVIAVAQKYISPKHKRFIDSIDKRLSKFDDLNENNEPLDTLNEVTQRIIRMI